MTEQCGDVPDDGDEYNRDERIETIYQGWGAREMAERIVDLEDELGDEKDGICIGMHADVAEANAEIERLHGLVRELDGLVRELDGACIGLSEELDEVSATNVELAKDARDGAHWEAVADRMRGEIRRLESLVGYWEHRAEEAGKDASYFEGWATANGHRLNGVIAERDRYAAAWKSARRRAKWARRSADSDLRFTRNMWSDALRDLNRYRLAWLSARRRAADEANYGLEALDLKAAEVVRLTVDRDSWQRGHETAESQLVYERRESARLRAELADLREAIREDI